MRSLRVKTALAHVADGRSDFFARREPLACQEIAALDWLREAVDVVESPVLNSIQEIRTFALQVIGTGAQSLVIHIPIWADPIFSIKLHNLINLPILLLGNDRPDTSSLVGILGAGGALDQIGIRHTRAFTHADPQSRREVLAFLRAASAVRALKGQTLGLFGSRSLGIFTAGYDPAQWQRLFGVDVDNHDQCEIIHRAESLDQAEVERHMEWLAGRLGSVHYNAAFTPAAFEKQVRSYIATCQLAREYGFDCVGVKCQPEMSDGYVTQCVSHCLMNGLLDADGDKAPIVHSCESDADGALTMQILHHLTGGQPASLLDIRWHDAPGGTWVLANCGAVAASFFATPQDPSGFSGLSLQPHVFGRGGGGALGGAVQPQVVTLARLCRRDGEYWMAILSATTLEMTSDDRRKTTPAFPQARIRVNTDDGFKHDFGSNHIHMVSGDYTRELVAFCDLAGISYKIW